jgi:predicted component of type VI protein secretion system
MYGGGKPGNYGLTGAQPQHPEPPPNPYGAAPGGGGGQAVLSGQVGQFPIPRGGQLAVGRDASRCQVVLQEPRVSGVHAILTFDGQQIMVRDEGSNNGTTVNGNRLQPGVATPVPAGSVVRFGPVEFVIRLS